VYTSEDIRAQLIAAFDPTAPMVELLGSCHRVSRETLFGKPNPQYVARELAWYNRQSFNINDFDGTPPAGWRAVASPDGLVNSNYGALLYSAQNGYQYAHVLDWLLREGNSGRRAQAIYTRPAIHEDAISDGRNDFICTNTVAYFLRDKRLHTVVSMRSNDVIWGYRNDVPWQMHVRDQLVDDLWLHGRDVQAGDMFWHAASLHLYPRHYNLVMREVLEEAAQKPSPGIACSRKAVRAWFGEDWGHMTANGGPAPCARELPGAVPASDYSDCPYLHAEEKLLQSANAAGKTLWVTHPPCPRCCKLIIGAGVKRVISGFDCAVDLHLDMDTIRAMLGERLTLVDISTT